MLISDSRVDNCLCLSSQTMSSYKDVAYMGDFAVNMTSMCRTMSKGARSQWDEFNDTSRTDTAELKELDSTDCFIEMDVWEVPRVDF